MTPTPTPIPTAIRALGEVGRIPPKVARTVRVVVTTRPVGRGEKRLAGRLREAMALMVEHAMERR